MTANLEIVMTNLAPVPENLEVIDGGRVSSCVGSDGGRSQEWFGHICII